MWEAQTIDLGSGRSLHAHQAGAGPDVVLLHGALATLHDWLESPVATELARDHRVTIVDRPGHGLSRRPRFSGAPREQAQQIAEGLEKLGVGAAVFAAHSFGGLVTLACAELFPERVAAMVLVAPIAFPEPRLLEHSLLAPRSMPILGPIFSQVAEQTQFDRAILAFVQKLMFAPQEIPAGWAATFPYDLVLDAEALVFEGEDAAAILPLSPSGSFPVAGIETPGHVLAGTADRIVEHQRQGKALARLLPNGRATEIEGAGHMLHHTHSDTVIAAIRDAAAPAAG
jgi:pimeloyl-ACP methyl ester carboxylesterase